MATHKIIGEGTYGCVAKPSLTCRGSARNYTNKVSKIMMSKYAISEYNEMKAITSIQGIDAYVVSLPELCIPVADKNFKVTIKDCENEKFASALDGDFRLLVYEDGGLSLKQFTTDVLPSLKTNDILIFLTKLHHLLEGLCFLNTHDIVHHDIKSRNIVYNIETNVIKFIDFGLVKKKSQLILECQNDKNGMAQTWENFPPEYDIANKSKYDLSNKPMPYLEFLNRLANTFDSYSFGIMMRQVMLKILRLRKPDISITGLQSLQSFFKKMGDPKIETRNYDIFKLPEEYKSLMNAHNLWNENPATASPKLKQIQNSLSQILDMSTHEMTSLKQAISPFKHLIACPETKERNPTTKRCVNKCKDGFIRNSQFQCRKPQKNVTSKKKSAKKKEFKPCTDSKERNPNTNRCVNKCKDGLIRNDLFQCIKP